MSTAILAALVLALAKAQPQDPSGGIAMPEASGGITMPEASGGMTLGGSNTTSNTASGGITMPEDPTKSCELPNGFKYEECGSGDSQTCCAPEQQCISAKPKDGDETFTCSAARKLVGNKAVRIVVLPFVLGTASIGVVAYMLFFWGFKEGGFKEPMTWLLVAQVGMSFFLFFSPFWTFGFYSVLLAVFVGSAWKSNDLAWWVYHLAWLLQFFQIIAIFGPFETFHVPFGGLSTFKNSMQEEAAGRLTSDAGACSTYYGGYFSLLPIEQSAENVNPNQKTFGYCVETWLGIVQFSIAILGLLQAGIVCRTAHRFVGKTTPAEDLENCLTSARDLDPLDTQDKPNLLGNPAQRNSQFSGFSFQDGDGATTRYYIDNGKLYKQLEDKTPELMATVDMKSVPKESRPNLKAMALQCGLKVVQRRTVGSVEQSVA